MKEEIPIEQRKGVFTRCKECKGYGYKKNTYPAWSTSSSYKTFTQNDKCKTCNGTGRLDWITRIIRNEYNKRI
jgi:DnaJ-class molecular chaperone